MFARWGARNETEQIEYLRKAGEFFGHRPAVMKLAWFKACMNGENRRMSLSLDKPGELTALGKTRVKLPPGTK